jgi:hypothetical protein
VSAGRIEQLKAMTEKARAGSAKTAATANPSEEKPQAPAAPPRVHSPVPDQSAVHHELVIEGVEIVPDEELILAPEAVAVVTENPAEQGLKNKIHIELLHETKFKGGDRKALTIRVCQGTERSIVPEAELMVKVLGTSFRPILFHSRSDDNGLSKLNLEIPRFETGRAALLIRVIVGGREHELRRAISPG